MSKREMYIKITPDLLSEIHDILKENSTNISDEAYKYIDYLECATEPVYYMGFHWCDKTFTSVELPTEREYVYLMQALENNSNYKKSITKKESEILTRFENTDDDSEIVEMNFLKANIWRDK